MNEVARTAHRVVCVLGVPGTAVADFARRLRDHGASIVEATPSDTLPSADVYLLLGPQPRPSPNPDANARLADERLRAALRDAGRAFQVIHDQGPAGLAQALRSVGLAPRDAFGGSTSARPRGDWIWSCDACSDPECEHRLFTRLARSS